MTEIIEIEGKSDAQRYSDALDFALGSGTLDDLSSEQIDRLVRGVLNAADAVRPTWPTDASLTALAPSRIRAWADEEVRDHLRAAFLADPIIQAAVGQAKEIERFQQGGGTLKVSACELRDAVRDAGLL